MAAVTAAALVIFLCMVVVCLPPVAHNRIFPKRFNRTEMLYQDVLPWSGCLTAVAVVG